MPPFESHLQDILSRIRFHGLTFEVTNEETLAVTQGEPEDGYQGEITQRYYLRVCAYPGSPYATCSVTAKPLPWKGRLWRLSQHMTDGEIVQTAFKAILTCLEHEARERFTFDGVTVFDPHFDIHELVTLRKSPTGGLKERQ